MKKQSNPNPPKGVTIPSPPPCPPHKNYRCEEHQNYDMEKLADAVHKAYCAYYLKNKGKEYWTKGDYSLLDEPTKQIDRETVKAVMEALNGKEEECECPEPLKNHYLQQSKCCTCGNPIKEER